MGDYKVDVYEVCGCLYECIICDFNEKDINNVLKYKSPYYTTEREVVDDALKQIKKFHLTYIQK